MHSAEKAQKPEPLIQQAGQKTVTLFLSIQKVHNLDSPCMCSGSHIIQSVIYEKKALCLLERKVVIAWSQPRVVHEYTYISFRSAHLCHGMVIFNALSLKQMCLKVCLMSLQCKLQV